MIHDYFRGKSVWITGASSGIGEALALELSTYNVKLILSARQTGILENIAEKCRKNGSLATTLPFDLSNEIEVKEAAQKASSIYGGVDILINNGGVTQRSDIQDTLVSVDRKIMEIDYFSGLILTKALLPSMITKGYGHIVAISSITGLFGFPQRSAYAAAKHAMVGFYETLWAELHTKGVNVTIVCPGRIQTPISLNAVTANGGQYGIMDHGQNTGIPVEKCAKQIIKAIYKRKNQIVIANFKEHLMIWFNKYIPWLFYKLVDKVQPT
ncbi:MAG TPA: SDR family oxidoreductase [Bacteroidales bacterium]|nr:SDR family oxidoreductase [Bacteroidales bacterium]